MQHNERKGWWTILVSDIRNVEQKRQALLEAFQSLDHEPVVFIKDLEKKYRHGVVKQMK